MLVHACDPSDWDVHVAGSGVRGHCWLDNRLEAGLSCIKLCLNNSGNDDGDKIK